MAPSTMPLDDASSASEGGVNIGATQSSLIRLVVRDRGVAGSSSPCWSVSVLIPRLEKKKDRRRLVQEAGMSVAVSSSDEDTSAPSSIYGALPSPADSVFPPGKDEGGIRGLGQSITARGRAMQNQDDIDNAVSRRMGVPVRQGNKLAVSINFDFFGCPIRFLSIISAQQSNPFVEGVLAAEAKFPRLQRDRGTASTGPYPSADDNSGEHMP